MANRFTQTDDMLEIKYGFMDLVREIHIGGEFPDGFEMAYSKSEGAQQSGSFRAPFDGLHGYYVMNLKEGPITIELPITIALNVAGHFDDNQEVYRAVDGNILTQLDL